MFCACGRQGNQLLRHMGLQVLLCPEENCLCLLKGNTCAEITLSRQLSPLLASLQRVQWCREALCLYTPSQGWQQTAAFCAGPHLAAGAARKLGVRKSQALVVRSTLGLRSGGPAPDMCYLLTNHLGASPPPSTEYL